MSSSASPLQAEVRSAGARRRPPAFGVLSSVARDNIYWFGTRGFVYTSPWVASQGTERQSAVVLLTASRKAFELRVGDAAWHERALVVAPLTRRDLLAPDVGLVSVNVQPHHPAFGAFCASHARAGPGVVALERRTFSRFDEDLARAYDGRLTHRAAERLFEGIIETAAEWLKAPRRRDGRAEVLHALLDARAGASLDDLARALDVSYTTASHLVSREIGLPFRTYRHWMKCMKATEHFGGELRLTDIAQHAGFADSAHLSRAWQRRFGLSPSYLRDPSHVRVFH